MEDIISIIILIVVIILFGFMIFNIEATNENVIEVNNTTNEIEEKQEIITVTDKWIKRTEERDLYMIGTEDEVFKIEDNAFILKFNSSDIYNKIKIRT